MVARKKTDEKKIRKAALLKLNAIIFINGSENLDYYAHRPIRAQPRQIWKYLVTAGCYTNLFLSLSFLPLHSFFNPKFYIYWMAFLLRRELWLCPVRAVMHRSNFYSLLLTFCLYGFCSPNARSSESPSLSLSLSFIWFSIGNVKTISN